MPTDNCKESTGIWCVGSRYAAKLPGASNNIELSASKLRALLEPNIGVFVVQGFGVMKHKVILSVPLLKVAT